MTAPNNPDIQAMLNIDFELYVTIEKKCLERMKYEGIDKDPRLSNKDDPFYGKPLEFAMHKIAYYMCYKCKKPYFAGLVDCGGGPGDNANNGNDNNNGNNANNELNPEQWICSGCADLSGIAGETNCLKHGKVLLI